MRRCCHVISRSGHSIGSPEQLDLDRRRGLHPTPCRVGAAQDLASACPPLCRKGVRPCPCGPCDKQCVISRRVTPLETLNTCLDRRRTEHPHRWTKAPKCTVSTAASSSGVDARRPRTLWAPASASAAEQPLTNQPSMPIARRAVPTEAIGHAGRAPVSALARALRPQNGG